MKNLNSCAVTNYEDIENSDQSTFLFFVFKFRLSRNIELLLTHQVPYCSFIDGPLGMKRCCRSCTQHCVVSRSHVEEPCRRTHGVVVIVVRSNVAEQLLTAVH